jgi:hypothetical protein
MELSSIVYGAGWLATHAGAIPRRSPAAITLARPDPQAPPLLGLRGN